MVLVACFLGISRPKSRNSVRLDPILLHSTPGWEQTSCRQAVWLVLHTVCLHWLETSNTLFQPLLGSYQKKFFWRLPTEANSKGFYYNELDS